MARKNANNVTNNKEQPTKDVGSVEGESATPTSAPLATAEAYAGALHGVEIAKGMKFTAADDEIRVVCLPFPEKLTDYKNEYQWIERTKEHELISSGIVRQVEHTPYGMGKIDVATVTAQHPSKGDDLKGALGKATMIVCSVAGCEAILVVDSAEAVKAAMLELAAASQVAEAADERKRLKMGVCVDPVKYGFAEFRGKGIIGIANPSQDVSEALKLLEKSEYGKLLHFSTQTSSTGDNIEFKYDGITHSLRTNDLMLQKQIYIANMFQEEFEDRNVSIGGRMLKAYLGLSGDRLHFGGGHDQRM